MSADEISGLLSEMRAGIARQEALLKEMCGECRAWLVYDGPDSSLRQFCTELRGHSGLHHDDHTGVRWGERRA